MADPKQKCTHEGCKCEVPTDRTDKFCSEYCAKDQGHAGHSHGCKCGHAGCG